MRDLTEREEVELAKRAKELDARTNQDIMREIAAIDSGGINQLAEKNAPTIDDIRRWKELEASGEEPRQIPSTPGPMF